MIRPEKRSHGRFNTAQSIGDKIARFLEERLHMVMAAGRDGRVRSAQLFVTGGCDNFGIRKRRRAEYSAFRTRATTMSMTRWVFGQAHGLPRNIRRYARRPGRRGGRPSRARLVNMTCQGSLLERAAGPVLPGSCRVTDAGWPRLPYSWRFACSAAGGRVRERGAAGAEPALSCGPCLARDLAGRIEGN